LTVDGQHEHAGRMLSPSIRMFVTVAFLALAMSAVHADNRRVAIVGSPGGPYTSFGSDLPDERDADFYGSYARPRRNLSHTTSEGRWYWKPICAQGCHIHVFSD
jgi:hypothetical protein